MAYNERVKNFNRIRDYMREFYVYGFKSRDEFTKKSARSYDDEKRRLESWLGDYMQFRQTADGKNVFLSIDSRLSRHNPLYKAWKTKSFTDGDITLHFIIFDILYDPEKKFSIAEIMKAIDTYLSEFQVPRMFDESTVRKKLKEYVNEGLIVSEKTGRTVYYRKSKMEKNPEACMLDFYSEVAPCGVIGSFLLDKLTNDPECFAFKHHYITSAMDSEIICRLFRAIREKRGLTIETINRKKNTVSDHDVIPLKISDAWDVKVYGMLLSAYIQSLMTGRGLDFATCSTAAGTAAKVAACTGFKLETGAAVLVKFANANSSASPTLNVNSTGAKNIVTYGTTAIGTYYWKAGQVVLFLYDGTSWQAVNMSTATTSYYGITKLSSSTSSTSTTLAATASAVKAAYDRNSWDSITLTNALGLSYGGTGATTAASDEQMKPQLEDKDVMTVQEAVKHYKLSRRKFYALLHEDGLPFLVFYYNERRLILCKEFEKYLDIHPEIRRRER